jgi:hypothetical protein
MTVEICPLAHTYRDRHSHETHVYFEIIVKHDEV